ncbi:hypothetical protein [Defluviimonas sp. WL0075]|uniref:Uncharacterized protein n=1 Tax=Albidovulum sediminicola TaxID=2984331 RepID=A0ABT2YWU5_9RHOB|nr:hypothetical protein [Defluviimonas sp. WL0075]MCV2863339.1 hypothetical protein [Defluviimonas sp. WL0075]
MAFVANHVGQLRAQQEQLVERIAQNEQELAANTAQLARLEDEMRAIDRNKAVLDGLIGLAEAQEASRKAATGDEAQMMRSMADALRDARTLLGSGNGLDELIAQFDALAKKAVAA